MKSRKISLCVPSYNRPDTLQQLIRSFMLQDYQNKELIISDDSSTDDVETLVKKLHYSRIHYYRNTPSLGFPKNLLASILHAEGDYLVTIGDDDVLFSPKSLSKYVEVFDNNPEVHFIYSNQVQFNSGGMVESIITKFKNDILFGKGTESLDNMFLHSIFIGGQGFRRNTKFKDLYPKKNILHPQVQLVGSILAEHASYGVADYCIGVRSHEDQIIFRALKNKHIQMDGDHMNIELPIIYRDICKKYSIKSHEPLLIEQLINNYPPVIIKEKMYLGNTILKKYYYKFCNLSPIAADSLKLKLLYAVSSITPTSVLAVFRQVMMGMVRLYNFSKFKKEEKFLQNILNTS